MPSVTIQINDAAARAAVASIADPKLQQTILEAAGVEVRVATIEHFRAREAEPENTTGFPKYGQSFGKRGFWAGTNGLSVAEAVRAPVYMPGENSVMVDIESPKLAHKANPSPPPIYPTGGRKYLAIPANPHAASWAGMPRDFPVAGGLAFVFSRTPEGRWMPSLAAREHYQRQLARGKRKGTLVEAAAEKATAGQGNVQFWLVRSAQTKHDPRAMPDSGILTSRANARAASMLQRLTS
jgi:hypothetical protein